MATPEYIKGAELPDVALTWTDEDTGLLDFSVGWTFTARIGHVGAAADLTKTTGITGAAIAPNLVIAWADGELDALDPDTYDVDVEANHVASSKDRKQRFQLIIGEQVGP